MPFKDPEKEREWRRKYIAEHPEQRRKIYARYKEKNREKILAYGREYTKRPEVIEKRKKYYLEHREEILLNAKRNRMMKKYESAKLPRWKHRKISRNSARRKRCGISIQREAIGYFWKAGMLSNGPFNYRCEAIKDAEMAFLL